MIASLIASAAIAAASAAQSAYKNKQARQEEQAAYRRSQLALDADRYRSPLSSLTNRTLLKSMDERLRDEREAEDNRAAASGATVENRLAARQSGNRLISDTYGRLLLGEDARQQAISDRQMALDNQHSQNVANNYRADAQNWQQWGAATAQAVMQYGMADYLSKQQPLLNSGANSSATNNAEPAVQGGWNAEETYKQTYGPDENGFYHA